ncbi:archaemetzincin family Zn-dependent metalloprotease [candidate division KSB1 bacterium]|nr:archaemetzincin family Zn-dependent metalloprotease [candidate division KSB1 bacterium]
MIEKYIHIVPIRFHDVFLLDALRVYLSRTFKTPVRIEKTEINIDKVYDPIRNQYNSSYLLAQLVENPPEDAARILAVCSFDLFIPILTFVFGEAQLEGIASIVSTKRLENEFYGATPDKHLLMERLLKEATHELGHTYNLYHCHNPGCVMNSSTYVEDIDEKSVRFCRECGEVVNSGIQ